MQGSRLRRHVRANAISTLNLELSTFHSIMHLTPTPEQQELKDAVRRFCQEQITPERLVTWERDALSIDVGLFRAVAELGWFGLGLPTAASGSGLGLVDVACLLEE